MSRLDHEKLDVYRRALRLLEAVKDLVPMLVKLIRSCER